MSHSRRLRPPPVRMTKLAAHEVMFRINMVWNAAYFGIANGALASTTSE